MGYFAFIILCVGLMVWDIVSDPHYTNKLKELEED